AHLLWREAREQAGRPVATARRDQRSGLGILERTPDVCEPRVVVAGQIAALREQRVSELRVVARRDEGQAQSEAAAVEGARGRKDVHPRAVVERFRPGEHARDRWLSPALPRPSRAARAPWRG